MAETQNPMQAYVESIKESVRLQNSRAEADTMKLAAWAKDLTFNREVFDEAWKTQFTADELKNKYVGQLKSAHRAVFFSTKPEVQAIVEKYKAGNYVVGIRRAYDMARGAAQRQPRQRGVENERANAAEKQAAGGAPAPAPQNDTERRQTVVAEIEQITDLAELAVILDATQRQMEKVRAGQTTQQTRAA